MVFFSKQYFYSFSRQLHVLNAEVKYVIKDVNWYLHLEIDNFSYVNN